MVYTGVPTEGAELLTVVNTGSNPVPQSPFETPVLGFTHPVRDCRMPGAGIACPTVLDPFVVLVVVVACGRLSVNPQPRSSRLVHPGNNFNK
jgi:hypothetical protein